MKESHQLRGTCPDTAAMSYKIARPSRVRPEPQQTEPALSKEDDIPNPFLRTQSLFKKKSSLSKSQRQPSPKRRQILTTQRSQIIKPSKDHAYSQYRNRLREEPKEFLFSLKSAGIQNNDNHEFGIVDRFTQTVGLPIQDQAPLRTQNILNQISFFDSFGKTKNEMMVIEKWPLRMGTQPYEYDEVSNISSKDNQTKSMCIFSDEDNKRKTTKNVTQFYLDLNSLGIERTQEEVQSSERKTINKTPTQHQKNFKNDYIFVKNSENLKTVRTKDKSPNNLVDIIYKLSDQLLELGTEDILRLEDELNESPMLENLKRLSDIVLSQPPIQHKKRSERNLQNQYSAANMNPVERTPQAKSYRNRDSNMKEREAYDEISHRMVNIEVKKLSKEKIQESIERRSRNRMAIQNDSYRNTSKGTRKKLKKGEVLTYSSKMRTSLKG